MTVKEACKAIDRGGEDYWRMLGDMHGKRADGEENTESCRVVPIYVRDESGLATYKRRYTDTL